jgi:glyceraldehyde 3-phosphate dehydrogenase
MTVHVAINGFGRVGCFMRRAHDHDQQGDIEVVAVNDLAAAPALADLLKRDSPFCRFPAQVVGAEGGISVDGARVLALVDTGPSALPWSELGVDVVPLLLTTPTWSVTAYSGTTSMFPISASDGEPL